MNPQKKNYPHYHYIHIHREFLLIEI